MTDFVTVGMLTGDEINRLRTKEAMSVPGDIKETRRSADIHSPLKDEYDMPAMMNFLLGRESATCEACQETVYHPIGGDLEESEPFVIRRLVKNVYTAENFVLLCETCVNRPPDEWRADVRRKRAQERDYAPTWTDHLAHWLSDPRATSLFTRRVAAAIAGVGAVVVFVAAVAGMAGTLVVDVPTGLNWASTVILTAGEVGDALATYPWFVGGLVGVAYIAHTVERVQYDPQGYLHRDRPPWIPLTLAGVIAGLGAVGLLGIATGFVSDNPLTTTVASTSWAVGAAGVAWYIDVALRHDLYRGMWRPSRGAWVVAGRVGIIPGLLAITVGVPFPAVFPATTTGILAAIPQAVVFAFVGLRLPYDRHTRDHILEELPDWLDGRREE